MKLHAVVICYDISNNRIRRKVHRILKEWRLDGQNSVCEARLSFSQAEELTLQLGEIIDLETDRLLLARIPQNRKVHARGLGRSDTFTQKLIRFI